MMELNEGPLGCHQKLLDCMKNGANNEAKMLLQNVENFCSLVDGSGSTLLHYAASYGNAAMVEHLIEMECNVNAVSNSGFTPLMLAVQNADATIVDILLKNNAYVLTVGNALRLALNCSMNSTLIPGRQKHQIILEMLFDKVNESYSSRKDVVTRLFLKGTDMDKFAFVVFGNVKLAEVILKNGYPLDFQEPTRGCTALHCAIIFAKFENAELLIKYDANTYSVNNSGFSPLRYYTWNFETVDTDSKVLKSFLRYYPDLYMPDQRGVTQVDYLLKYGQKKTTDTVMLIGFEMVMIYGVVKNAEEEEKVAKIAMLLLQNGFDAQHIFTNGTILIELLILREDMASVRIFVEHLALIKAVDQGFLTERTRNTIESNPELKDIFDLHTQKLESLKNVVLCGTVTLFKILTERQDKLVNYARNQDLIPHLNWVLGMKAVSYLDSCHYYFNTIRKRLSYALERAPFETRVASIIQALTGLCADTYHVIVYKIIGYLGLQDLNNLCRAVGNHFAMEY